MKKQLLSELAKMGDCDFFTLEHHVTISRMVRDIMSKNGIDEKKMAFVLGVQPRRMREIINGAYPFDLMILAKLQAFNQKIESENARFKIEAESVGFVNYKNSYPLYIEKLDKILKFIDEKR